jgi:hypothetical protein
VVQKNLLGILSTWSAGFSGLGLDEKVDEEQAWEKSSQNNSQVSTELNLKGKRGGGHGFNDGIQGKCGSSKCGNRESTSSDLSSGLGNWNKKRALRREN